MASKRFTLLALLVVAAVSTGYSQLGGVLDYLDSTKVSSRNLPKYNEWKSNSKSNFFPPVPKAMGQLSINGGLFLVDGDCPSLPGWNIGVSYRKALGYTVSLRGGINYAQGKGLDYRDNGNLDNNPVLVQTYGSLAPSAAKYVHNYKTTVINPSLDLIINFNNIMFHRKSSKFAFYGLIGYSPMVYQTKMDVLNGNAAYNFGSLNASYFQRPRKDIRNDLKNFFDGSYETFAQVNDRSQNFNQTGNDKFQWRHAFSTGLGTELRIASRMSLGFEFKYLWTRDDYVDGWFMNNGGLSPDKDGAIFTNLFVNFNL